MFNEVPETKIEPIVTIPLSEYRELISKATRFDILKMDIEEMYIVVIGNEKYAISQRNAIARLLLMKRREREKTKPSK
jgi:hypothetical protein